MLLKIKISPLSLTTVVTSAFTIIRVNTSNNQQFNFGTPYIHFHHKRKIPQHTSVENWQRYRAHGSDSSLGVSQKYSIRSSRAIETTEVAD